MKNSLSKPIILYGMLLLLISACAPKYGAHFNQSSNFYEPAVATADEKQTESPTEVQKIEAETSSIDAEQLVASKDRLVLPTPPPKVQQIVKEYEEAAKEIKSKDLTAKEEKKALKKESKKVRKKLKKEIKKEVETLKEQDSGGEYVVAMILAILLPPLGVGLTYGISSE
ncbi:YqaE/Pmp3 family membrane protein, partial [Fulvivirga sp. RKSG066]|uniref:YqaE/Pmp3 family membrane protein n=1 Tax=Fulvivirga aurantia TaxID=2529383 RepID=UPI0012BB4975